jgi:hypothetical protein
LEKGGFDDEPREYGAAGGGGIGMGRRQPQMQWEEGRLGEQSGCHQPGRDPDGGRRANPASQKDDVERAISPVKQSGAKQIKDRTE